MRRLPRLNRPYPALSYIPRSESAIKGDQIYFDLRLTYSRPDSGNDTRVTRAQILHDSARIRPKYGSKRAMQRVLMCRACGRTNSVRPFRAPELVGLLSPTRDFPQRPRSRTAKACPILGHRSHIATSDSSRTRRFARTEDSQYAFDVILKSKPTPTLVG